MRQDRELLRDAVDAIEAVMCTECAEPWGLIEEIRARLAELENQTETDLFTYAKGYEDGKQYVTHRVKRVLEGKPVPAAIDCGLFEVKDKSTVTNLNLADGVYRLLAVREYR
jgi:hypothetical protein